MRTTRLALAAGAVPLAALGGVWALQAAWSARLPEVVAIHWGTDGPDRSSALSTLTGVTLGIGAALTLGTLVAVLVSRARGSAVPRSAVGFTAGVAALPAGVLAGSMYAALDTTSWRDAGSAWSAVVWALGLSVVAGAVAALVAGPTERRAPAEPRDLPSAGLRPGERATWIGGGTNYPMTFGGLAVAGGYALLQVSLPGFDVMPLALVVLVVVLAMAATCRVRIRVDADGVALSLGLFGFPHRTLTFDEIASADTEQLTMWSAGGYGLRRGVGYTAFKVRAGEALAVTLTSGHVVKATVDHADRAAGLVNDLVAARESA
ncbi:hypothetical protein LY13_001749 [Prauserella aidingensis]|uniref:DUF1648 domain-containing protein n=1 Tax=Prauserella aidingensis TaxID=387890 RepID=UPI0020A59620|nr:DUF1648 domain-containing protein [Prauserella aidingensis]MCP2253005.1 hypothetical protein [Prauserella aidingensis]